MSADFDPNSIADDLEIDAQYPEQKVGNSVPLPGNYRARATKVDYKRNRTTGDVVLWKQKYPVISLPVLEVTEPAEYARKVGVFHEVPTMPFERDGKNASPAADVLLAIDPDFVGGNVLGSVMDRLNAGMEFNVRLDYSAYDTQYVKGEMAQYSRETLGDTAYFKARDEVVKKGSIKGYKRIQQSNTKAGKTELGFKRWVGPTGNIVDVKPIVSAFYPGNQSVTFGPDPALISK